MRLLSLSLFVLILAACGTSKTATSTTASGTAVEEKTMSTAKAAADVFLGSWNYSVNNTPAGSLTGELVVSKTDGQYSAYILDDGTRYDMKDLKIDGEQLSGKIYYPLYGGDAALRLKHNPADGTLSGMAIDTYSVTATRKK